MTDKVSPDIIGLTGRMIYKVGRFVMNHVGKDEDSFPRRILLAWKRQDVCTEMKERGKDPEKLYPKLVDKGWNGHNRVLKYKLPTGLSYKKILKNIDLIESDLKCEVIPKLLENDPSAHFSLTILSGHLLDYIEYTNEAEKLKDGGLWIPLGWSRRALEQINLADNNSPHLMLGGGTGAGKSTLARLILVSNHVRYTREDVRLWLCDLKHGNDIAMLGEDPLLVDKVISDPMDVEGLMDKASIEIGRRYELFKAHKCPDINAFNKKYPNKREPHIIILVDELTKLEGKDFIKVREKMSRVTGEARGAGVHMIISTHRPTANLVSGTMKNNIPAVVAFRCNPVSARVLLGEDEWESAMMIDKEIDGRALFKWKDEVLIQVPYITDEKVEEIMSHYQKPKKTQIDAPQEIKKSTTDEHYTKIEKENRIETALMQPQQPRKTTLHRIK